MSRSASWKGRGKAFGLLLAVLQLAQFSRIMIDRFGQGSICLQRDRQEAGVSSMVQGEVPGPRSMCVGQTERAVMGHRLCGELLDRFGRLRLLASQRQALRCRRYCFGGGLVVSDARRGCWRVNDSVTATIVSRKEKFLVVEYSSQAALTGQSGRRRLRLPARRFARVYRSKLCSEPNDFIGCRRYFPDRNSA